MNGERPWMLVAPWYRWPSQGVPARESRPVFQKYETPKLVKEFLADPQHSLRFVDEDFHHYLDTLPPLPDFEPDVPPRFTNRIRRLTDRTLVRTGIRKLFLDSHKRFYLVVCELHCDAPGFPSADRMKACEAGFVVRRRRVTFPQSAAKEAALILRDISKASAQLAELERLAGLAGSGTGSDGMPVPPAVAARLAQAVDDWRTSASSPLLQERLKLVAWATKVGATRTLEGWVPSGSDGIGSWQPVAEQPSVVSEAVLPLYPLVPDPRLARHAGAGRTIYFGLVPTASSDAEADGTARFDDTSLCEVRCFVRRHDDRCLRTGQRNDCHGKIVWSEPTETYRLAPHFDPVGTSKRPITIQLPDIPALSASSFPPAVKMVSPPGSGFVFPQSNDIPDSGSMNPAEEICTFAIPLITIVATFVLNLFLPIVVFVFQLWFLLKLKFCIPPSVEIDAHVSAELALIPPAIDITADFDMEMTVDQQEDLQDALADNFDDDLGEVVIGGVSFGAGAHLTGIAHVQSQGKDPFPGYTNAPIVQLRGLSADRSRQPLTFTAGLEYEAEVSVDEVST